MRNPFRRPEPPEPEPIVDPGIALFEEEGPIFHYPDGLRVVDAWVVIWTDSHGDMQPVYFPALVPIAKQRAAGWIR